MVRTEADKRFKANIATKRPVRKKPKDKPKRPLSAYNYFFKEERQRILKYIGRTPDEVVTEAVVNADEEGRLWTCTGKVSFEEMGKIIGGRWKAMDSETLKKYTALALGDAGRYKHELKAWNEKKEMEKKNAVGNMYPYHPPGAMPHYNPSPYPLTMPPTQAYHYNPANPPTYGGSYPHPPPHHPHMTNPVTMTNPAAMTNLAATTHPAPTSHPTNTTPTGPIAPPPAYNPNPMPHTAIYPPSTYAIPENRPIPKATSSPLATSTQASLPVPAPGQVYGVPGTKHVMSPSPTNEPKIQPPNEKGHFPPTEFANTQPPDPASEPSSSSSAPPSYYPQGQYYGSNYQTYPKNSQSQQQRWN